jgi:hypothetical protein
MRIKKNEIIANQKIAVQKKSNIEATTDNKAEAKRYIKCAIDTLGASAKDGDIVSRDALANLSVILFDLK